MSPHNPLGIFHSRLGRHCRNRDRYDLLREQLSRSQMLSSADGDELDENEEGRESIVTICSGSDDVGVVGEVEGIT